MKMLEFTVAAVVLAGFFGMSGQRVAGEETAGVFEPLDGNGDGVLETSEMPSQLAQRVAQLDKDGDGKLNAAEIAPVADRLARMGGSKGSGGSKIYVVNDGKEDLKTILQTDKMEERMEHASYCGPTLKFTFPTVVDKVDNKVNKDYAGWPSRFVVVGVDGKIAYDGGPGPQGFQPAALEGWLKANVK